MIEISAISVAADDGVYAVIVKPTPAFGSPSKQPSLVDPFIFDLLVIILVFAVTDVLATAIVPKTRVDWPILALDPDLSVIPFPAVPRIRLPLVNVALPRVSKRVPLVRVALPDVRTRLPLVRVTFPDVSTKFPLERVIVPVVRVNPPVDFGVKTNPIAALVPVPVKVLPEASVMALAVVVT